VAYTEKYIAAPPEKVFGVLSDPDSYGYWVVGSKEIRDAEPEWPAAGSKFHHTVGFGPFTVKDHTVAKRSVRPTFLELKARARPFGTAIVTHELEPEGNGTRVKCARIRATP
jgi:uncharacterized protein YndB with AHSA1/START domain